jgi:hypothetical protein
MIAAGDQGAGGFNTGHYDMTLDEALNDFKERR